MGEGTEITWADHTFNPWWGCVEVSPACDHCYARTWARRAGVTWGTMTADGELVPRRFFSDAHWRAPEKWNRDAARAGRRARVFCASMGDVFEDRPDLLEPRRRLWKLIEATPWLDWLLLTKRPQHLWTMVPWVMAATPPWSNVWLGVTAEDQRWADERIPMLLATPAAVRFVSYEPALGPIDFTALCGGKLNAVRGATVNGRPDQRLDWIIIGDESGANRRPADLAWVRSVRDQLEGSAVALHFKQWVGATAPGLEGERSGRDRTGKIHLPILDGRRHPGFPR